MIHSMVSLTDKEVPDDAHCEKMGMKNPPLILRLGSLYRAEQNPGLLANYFNVPYFDAPYIGYITATSALNCLWHLLPASGENSDPDKAYATTTGILPMRACHSLGPVSCTDVPCESTATVTGMSCTVNS